LDHTYTIEGKKAVYQTIHLTNGKSIFTLITLYVVAPHMFDSFALQFIPSSLSLQSYKQFDLVTSLIGSAPKNMLFLGQRYGDNQHSFDSSSLPRLPFSTKYTYTYGAMYTPSTIATRDVCTQLQAHATLSIPKQEDFCLHLLLTQGFSEYPDMDKDGVPDICDTDIDGDGIPNLLGIILPQSAKQNNYTTLSTLNMNILQEHFK